MGVSSRDADMSDYKRFYGDRYMGGGCGGPYRGPFWGS